MSPHDHLDRAIQLTLSSSQKDFPVLDGTDVVGVLTQTDLLKALQEQGEQAIVSDWMQAKLQSAEMDEPIEKVLQRLQVCQCRLLSVTEAGRLVGIINMDNIMELLSIQKALHEDHKQTKWQA